MSNDLLRCVFLLGRAAEFNVPSMRASAVSKRSRPLFARSSSAIVRRSGTRGVVGRRFHIRDDGSFRDGLRRMRVLSDTPAPRPVKRRIQRKNHSLQNAVGEISGTKTINALTQTNASKTSQSGKRFSKTRLARISGVSAYKKTPTSRISFAGEPRGLTRINAQKPPIKRYKAFQGTKIRIPDTKKPPKQAVEQSRE